MKIKHTILSYLLHIANRDVRPEILGRFYNLKRRLLKQYGAIITTDKQYIEYKCWTCSNPYVKECSRCEEGVYSTIVVYLYRYQYGKYIFHVPASSCYHEGKASRFNEFVNSRTIEGRIKHKKPRFGLGLIAMFTLVVLVDRPEYKFYYLHLINEVVKVLELERLRSYARRYELRLFKRESDDIPF